MTGIILGPGRLYLAPVGTSPGDVDAWKPIGTVDDITLTLDPGSAVPVRPGALPPITFTMPNGMVRVGWKGHLLAYRRRHPGQQHAKALYRRRARRRGRR
ncbi:hypothetical protein [Nonomuraea sp. NPDC003214]